MPATIGIALAGWVMGSLGGCPAAQAPDRQAVLPELPGGAARLELFRVAAQVRLLQQPPKAAHLAGGRDFHHCQHISLVGTT